RNQAPKSATPDTTFRLQSKFLSRNADLIDRMGRHVFLLSAFSAKRWYRVPTQLYKKRRRDSRTLAAECCRTARDWLQAQPRSGHGHWVLFWRLRLSRSY